MMTETTARAALLGLPYDEHSSFLKGSADGPAAFREALYSEATTLYTEAGLDLSAGRLEDMGDLLPRAGEDYPGRIGEAAAEIAARGLRPLFIGGDHAVTFPIVRGLFGQYGPLQVVHFDAHPDLYDELNGDRYSHACPFARIMEAGLAGRLVQVGVRNINQHQREQAGRFGVEMREMREIGRGVSIRMDGPVYISFDLDALDPAFAPGVSHHEPGGLSTRQAIDMIQNLDGRIIGADIVELNPKRDVSGITAAAAAKLAKELLGRLLEDGGER